MLRIGRYLQPAAARYRGSTRREQGAHAVGHRRGRDFSAALASYVAALEVFFAFLGAEGTVLAAVLVSPEAVLAAVGVALRAAPFAVLRIEDAGGRRMPCALSKALTASDNSLTRSLSFSTSEDV